MIKRIVIDFDGVIVDSIKAITRAYEWIDCLPDDTYNPSQVKVWNFKDVIPHATNDSIEKLFESNLFWNNLELIDGAKEFIDEFREHVVICSIGSNLNQIKKLAWIREHLGDVSCIPIVTNMDEHPKRINKNLLNMENCIYIEDSGINLDMCNAEVNILFNNYGNFNAEWARCSHYDYKCTDWKEISEIVRKYIKGDN